MSVDRVRQWANLLLAPLQFLSAALSTVFGVGRPVGAQATGGLQPPELPLGYAFSIWAVIFALGTAYAIVQARPSRAADPLYRAIGWWTAVSFLAGNLWMVRVQLLGDGWPQVFLILVMFGGAAVAFLRLLDWRGDLSTLERWTAVPALGLVSGWLTVAIFLNMSSVLRDAGLLQFIPAPTDQALLILCLAGTTALGFVAASRGNIWYAAAVVWALVAVVGANVWRAPNTPVAVTAASLLVLVIMTTAVASLRRRPLRRAPQGIVA
jgi:hypothetical protein